MASRALTSGRYMHVLVFQDGGDAFGRDSDRAGTIRFDNWQRYALRRQVRGPGLQLVLDRSRDELLQCHAFQRRDCLCLAEYSVREIDRSTHKSIKSFFAVARQPAWSRHGAKKRQTPAYHARTTNQGLSRLRLLYRNGCGVCPGSACVGPEPVAAGKGSAVVGAGSASGPAW